MTIRYEQPQLLFAETTQRPELPDGRSTPTHETVDQGVVEGHGELPDVSAHHIVTALTNLALASRTAGALKSPDALGRIRKSEAALAAEVRQHEISARRAFLQGEGFDPDASVEELGVRAVTLWRNFRLAFGGPENARARTSYKNSLLAGRSDAHQ